MTAVAAATTRKRIYCKGMANGLIAPWNEKTLP